jgi:hypothetical protein
VEFHRRLAGHVADRSRADLKVGLYVSGCGARAALTVGLYVTAVAVTSVAAGFVAAGSIGS